MIKKKIGQGPRPDSESDQFKYKAAERILQSRSLRFLMTEKSSLGGSLPRKIPRRRSLCQEKGHVLGHYVKSQPKTC